MRELDFTAIERIHLRIVKNNHRKSFHCNDIDRKKRIERGQNSREDKHFPESRKIIQSIQTVTYNRASCGNDNRSASSVVPRLDSYDMMISLRNKMRSNEAEKYSSRAPKGDRIKARKTETTTRLQHE
jgi:hypothetical protein